jgi:tRNA threonylcarbamoyladenosine biosynthesis protein TsaB
VSEPWLILETSGRSGMVGLARGGRVVRSAVLDETRRHARDLSATIDAVLKDESLGPRDLFGVMVGVGPGSYTGLRVGIVSAKVLAYAVGCRLVAVPTFRAIVERVPDEYAVADVIGDALQGKVYVQRFVRTSTGWTAVQDLRIEPVAAWLDRRLPGAVVTGPGLAAYDGIIPEPVIRVSADLRSPTVEAVFAAGARIDPLGRDELFRIEPLYLRGSSAEEKAKAGGSARSGAPAA